MLSAAHPICRLISLFVITGLLLCNVQAQSSQTTLRGKVLDPARAPIVGAHITATPDGSASGFSVVSDQFGEFSLPLKPGSYKLRVNAQGFEESSQAVTINQGGSEPLELVLEIARSQNTVTVVGS